MELPGAAAVFAHANRGAELAAGLVQGSVPGYSFRLQLLGTHVDVKPDLIVEFLVKLRAPSQIPDTTEDFFHSTVPITSWIERTSRSNSAASVVSCRRP